MSDGKSRRSPRRLRSCRARRIALVTPLAVAADGEQATAVLADLKAWQAMQQSPGTRGAADAFFRELGPQAEALGANFRAADAAVIVQRKIDAERDLCNGQGVIDFVPAARVWLAQMQREGLDAEFSERLNAASAAEAVRPDGDALRAADLHLAGRAVMASTGGNERSATAPVTRPSLDAFPGALAAMEREHELNRRPVAAQLAEEATAIRAAGSERGGEWRCGRLGRTWRMRAWWRIWRCGRIC